MDVVQRHQPSPDRLDAVVARFTSTRFGVLSRDEARALGATPAEIRARLASGRWEETFRGVYRIAGTAIRWDDRVYAACLAAGPDAAASHLTAARIWELTDRDADAVTVTVSHGRRISINGVDVRRTRDWIGADLTHRRGIPVTTLPRTLIDLAATLPVDAVEEALDEVLRRRLTSRARIRATVERLARNGRAGVPAIRALLDARAPGSVPESVIETRFLGLVRRARLPLPVAQYEVRARGRLVARVDFAYPDLLIAIELDGYGFHHGRARFERDRARGNALTVLGWRVIRITWAQLVNEPDEVVRVVAAALGVRAPGSRSSR